MARDAGLEEMIDEILADQPGVSTKAMFGGLAWLMDGNLLCAGGTRGMLVRLGKGQDGWATVLPGVEAMVMKGRNMPGWVWVSEDAYGDDELRGRLMDAAIAFVRTLPPK